MGLPPNWFPARIGRAVEGNLDQFLAPDAVPSIVQRATRFLVRTSNTSPVDG
jgi:hypothetical protein